VLPLTWSTLTTPLMGGERTRWPWLLVRPEPPLLAMNWTGLVSFVAINHGFASSTARHRYQLATVR
jgi:hypothetical protein